MTITSKNTGSFAGPVITEELFLQGLRHTLGQLNLPHLRQESVSGVSISNMEVSVDPMKRRSAGVEAEPAEVPVMTTTTLYGARSGNKLDQ